MLTPALPSLVQISSPISSVSTSHSPTLFLCLSPADNSFFLLLQIQFSSSVKFRIALLFLCLSHHSRLTRLAAKINSTQNLCRPPNKQTTNRRTDMCERERERERVGKKEEKLSVEKITKLAFKFLLTFCSLQSKQIDSSKRTKHLPHPSAPSGTPQATTEHRQRRCKQRENQCWTVPRTNADEC